MIVGTIDAAVIGYAAVELETLRDGTRLGVITELFVDPEARGVGVGEAIAEQLVAFCTARRVHRHRRRRAPGTSRHEELLRAHGLHGAVADDAQAPLTGSVSSPDDCRPT